MGIEMTISRQERKQKGIRDYFLGVENFKSY